MKTQKEVPVLKTDSAPLNPFILVSLVVLGSFTVGLVPITYSSALVNPDQTSVALGQAALWSVFGEKDLTVTHASK